MLKKIIIIENDEQVQCDTLEEVVKILIDENYYNMDQSKKIEKMKMKALANCINNKKTIVQEIKKDMQDITEFFVIKDEITYILSLLMTDNIMLLERKDANIFSGELDKENIENNYIIINQFAKELLEKYIARN